MKYLPFMLLLLVILGCNLGKKDEHPVENYLHKLYNYFDSTTVNSPAFIRKPMQVFHNGVRELQLYGDTILTSVQMRNPYFVRTTPEFYGDEILKWFVIGNIRTHEVYYVFPPSSAQPELSEEYGVVFDPVWYCGRQLSYCMYEGSILPYTKGARFYEFPKYNDTIYAKLWQQIEQEYHEEQGSVVENHKPLTFHNYTCEEVGNSKLIFLQKWKKRKMRCWDLVL